MQTNANMFRYPEEQTSITVRLGGGKAYYIQGVGAQDIGRDCFSIGMQLPNGKMSRPIKGEYVSRSPLGLYSLIIIFSR